MKKIKQILLILLIAAAAVNGQNKNADEILDKAKKGFDKVEDYTVDAKITVEMDFLKVPESNAKIYFKKPGKFKIDSEGFALFPKKGLNFSPEAFLEEDYSAVYARQDTIDGALTDVIKIVPTSDTAKVILTTLWIDSRNGLIKKVATTPKQGGSAEISLKYGKAAEYKLPSEIEFSFNVDTPAMAAAMQEPGEAAKTKTRKSKMSGKVIVNYSDYKINTGLEDSFFDEEEEK